jgi:hypothetical protein
VGGGALDDTHSFAGPSLNIETPVEALGGRLKCMETPNNIWNVG